MNIESPYNAAEWPQRVFADNFWLDSFSIRDQLRVAILQIKISSGELYDKWKF